MGLAMTISFHCVAVRAVGGVLAALAAAGAGRFGVRGRGARSGAQARDKQPRGRIGLAVGGPFQKLEQRGLAVAGLGGACGYLGEQPGENARFGQAFLGLFAQAARRC